MRFGYHHASFAGTGDRPPFDAVVDRARRVEAAGFDLFTVMDHVWQLPHNGHRGRAHPPGGVPRAGRDG